MQYPGGNRSIYLATCFFVISNILDHNGHLSVKYISFFTLFFSLTFVRHRLSENERTLILMLIFFSILSVFNTIINGGELSVAISNSYFLITCIFYVFLVKQIDKTKILHFIMTSLFYCSLMILAGNIFSLVIPMEGVINFLKIFAMTYDSHDGIRENTLNLMPRIYFHFTLFLPSALAYHLFNRKYVRSILLLVAVILSVSRGAIIASLFVVLCNIFSFYGIRDFLKKITAICLFAYALNFIIYSFVPGIFDHFEELGNLSNRSVEVRNDQIISVLNLMMGNIFYFFFGMGSGTPYYSSIHQEYLYNIEIAPLEIFRRHGFIFLLVSFTFIFTLVFKNLKINKVNSIILSSLLIATFTNPILTSPLFILIYFLFV